MTPNRRIVLNVIATYGRSLYALAVGLLCGRWALMSLGQVDYGLYGLVGGLVGFVSFFNSLLASAVGRFYAVSVGASKKEGNEIFGLEDCRKWFNTAVSIHTVIPICLLIIGYPIGCWVVEHFLEIPLDRVMSCIWVWRYTCISCFVAMLNVPFQAMYTAKQEIAELTIYSFIATTLNACFLSYMITHPGVWLTRYAAWMCFVSVVPAVIIAFRAISKYPECQIRMDYFYDRDRIMELSKYAFARFIADFSGMVSFQARAILVNKYMGPRHNASMSVSNVVTSQTQTLAGALSGALWPAVANKAGEGDEESVRKLSFVACRVGAILMLFFAIPLCLEVREVLLLWLDNPPPFAAELCVAILIASAFEKLTDGYWMAILGLGRGVMLYSHRICMAGFAFVATCWLLFALGFGMWSMCVSFVVYSFLMVGVRLWLGRKLVGFCLLYWLRRVLIPIVFLTVAVAFVGAIPMIFLAPSFLRVTIVTLCCEVVFVPCAWQLVLEPSEREFLRKRFFSKFKGLRKNDD